MAVRNFINGAQLITLTVAVNTTDVTLTVASTAGYPAVPFVGALERGTSFEEVVLVTAKTATTFTVTRAWDGTTGKNHAIGAAFEHTSSAADYAEANAHVNDSTNDVHPQYLRKAAFTAKGVTILGTGVGTIAALTVGANETVLQADSAQATGQKWGTIGANSITDGSLSETEFTTSVVQSLIARQSSAPTGVNGREYYDTTIGRPFVYIGSWLRKTFGVGLVTVSTAAPSGGVDGDVWLRY